MRIAFLGDMSVAHHTFPLFVKGAFYGSKRAPPLRKMNSSYRDELVCKFGIVL